MLINNLLCHDVTHNYRIDFWWRHQLPSESYKVIQLFFILKDIYQKKFFKVMVITNFFHTESYLPKKFSKLDFGKKKFRKKIPRKKFSTWHTWFDNVIWLTVDWHLLAFAVYNAWYYYRPVGWLYSVISHIAAKQMEMQLNAVCSCTCNLVFNV